MIDRRIIREQTEMLRRQFAARRKQVDLDGVLELDQARRRLIQETERLKARRNEASTEVPRRRQAGQPIEELLAEMKQVSRRIKELDAELTRIEERSQALLLTLPNRFHDSVPIGDGEDDNREIRRWGEPRQAPLEHWQLGQANGTLDFERGVRMAQSRFTLMRGLGARLERALINLFLDMAVEHGYQETLPPLLVNRDAMVGTGQIPNLEEEMFRCRDDELWLIPTAEVPLTNIHRGEILTADELPRCYAASTPCFRREAGSYGKDVKGLIRQHQFNKVELVRLVHPDRSYDELEILLGHAEAVLRRLELPYRVVDLCSADLSFAAAKCYDLEVWLPGQGRYREISSCSNFEAFQARRCGIRFKPKGGGRAQPVHTLNGSALAVGRTVVALYENHQQPDGSIRLPASLQPYMDGRDHIPAG